MFSYIYLLTSFILSILIMLKTEQFGKIYGFLLLAVLITVCYTLLFALHILIFALIGFTIHTDKLPESIHNIYRKIGFDTLKVFLDTLQVHVHANGMERVPDGKFLLVCNHLTAFDPMIELLLFKKYNLAFVSKQENMRIPFVGRYMSAVGCIPLNREDAREALKSINKAADYIITGKANMGIYPEGRVNKSEDVLLPFRNGAFRIAKKADVPILVATIRGTEAIRHQFLRRRTQVYVDVLEVVPEETVKSSSTTELSNLCRDIMEKHLLNVKHA